MPEKLSSHSRSSLGEAASICCFLRRATTIAPTTASAPTVAATIVPTGVLEDEADVVVAA